MVTKQIRLNNYISWCVYIDERLNLQEHVKQLSTKLSQILVFTKVEITFDNQAVTFGIQLPDITISYLLQFDMFLW